MNRAVAEKCPSCKILTQKKLELEKEIQNLKQENIRLKLLVNTIEKELLNIDEIKGGITNEQNV
jgi:hypothetical protein